MSKRPDQIRKHIEVISDFEQKYGEFLVARHNRSVEGYPQWSNKEWAKRERELRMLAPRAEAAIEASGVAGLALHWPMALGGGVKSDDLASLIFDFQDAGFSVEATDDEFQWAILHRIPSQIAGLEMRLEEVEANRAKGPQLIRDSHLPKLFSRIANLPPWLGFIADLITVIGFAVVVVGGAARLLGIW